MRVLSNAAPTANVTEADVFHFQTEARPSEYAAARVKSAPKITRTNAGNLI